MRRTGAQGRQPDSARPIQVVSQHSAREDTIVGAAQMFIDGKWTASRSGKTYDVPNPATEETIGSAPDASVEDMQRAIAAARKAFDDGPWPRSSRQERYRALMRIGDALERRKEEMRSLLVAEAAATYIEHGIQV